MVILDVKQVSRVSVEGPSSLGFTEGDTEGWLCGKGSRRSEDSYSQPPRGSQEAVRLGRTPDTNCIPGLESRHCGPYTWNNSPNDTAERWGGGRGSSDRGLFLYPHSF